MVANLVNFLSLLVLVAVPVIIIAGIKGKFVGRKPFPVVKFVLNYAGSILHKSMCLCCGDRLYWKGVVKEIDYAYRSFDDLVVVKDKRFGYVIYRKKLCLCHECCGVDPLELMAQLEDRGWPKEETAIICRVLSATNEEGVTRKRFLLV